MSKLTKLIMTVDNPEGEELTYQKSSLLQGVLMERVSEAYAEKMHLDGLRPYSQNLQVIGDKMVWEVNALSEEAYDEIISPLLSDEFQSFKLKHNDVEYGIASKELSSITTEQLIEQYYLGDCARKINVSFQTPTAFRQNHKYVFYPDIRLIYNSLMSRFDAFEELQSMYSEEVLDQLTEFTQVTGYNLRSRMYSLEGVKIPSYTGSISLIIHGPSQLVNLVQLLLRYGEFSGVGIKTAIGMGKLRIRELTPYKKGLHDMEKGNDPEPDNNGEEG